MSQRRYLPRVRARFVCVFTGIVEELGEVVGKEDLSDSARLVIRGPVVTADARHGDSIAVNGVCLTVVAVLPDGQFSTDVMAETLDRSSLAALVAGGRVNLERAAALSSRLGGHIVQGHVNGRLARSVGELGGGADSTTCAVGPLRRVEGLDHRGRGFVDGVGAGGGLV